MAARLRHIALSVPDPDKAAKFFEDAFGMKRVGKAGIGCYVSDGTINVALLKYDGEVPGFHKGYHGLVHFGMWVDNLDGNRQESDGRRRHLFRRPTRRQSEHLLRGQIPGPERNRFRFDPQWLARRGQGSRSRSRAKMSRRNNSSAPPRQRGGAFDKEPRALAEFGGKGCDYSVFDRAPFQVGAIDSRFGGGKGLHA